LVLFVKREKGDGRTPKKKRKRHRSEKTWGGWCQQQGHWLNYDDHFLHREGRLLRGRVKGGGNGKIGVGGSRGKGTGLRESLGRLIHSIRTRKVGFSTRQKLGERGGLSMGHVLLFLYPPSWGGQGGKGGGGTRPKGRGWTLWTSEAKNPFTHYCLPPSWLASIKKGGTKRGKLGICRKRRTSSTLVFQIYSVLQGGWSSKRGCAVGGEGPNAGLSVRRSLGK